MRRRLLDLLLTALLASCYLLLLYAAISNIAATGSPYLLVLAVQESFILGMILCRRRAQTSSASPKDWVAAFLGTFLPLLFRAGVPVLPTVGLVLQLSGLALSAIGVLSLGRSFGLVAANRGVQTGGLYGLVRHPLYGCYILAYSGLFLANASLVNGVLLVLWVLCQHTRAVAEERILLRDPAYAAYHAQVRFRYLPGLI